MAHWLKAFSWLLLACLLAGCTPQGNTGTDEAADRLRALAVNYQRYAGQHQGNGPPSEQKFKEFVKKMGVPEGLTIDELFVSPRDNQPFEIRYKIRPGFPGPDSPVIMWEQTGDGSTRRVARASGAVIVVPEAEFAQLKPK
jgi:hypothetical protein